MPKIERTGHTVFDVYNKEYNIKVVGHRLLVEVDPVQEQGAIVLPDKLKEQEQLGQAFGTIIAIGDQCWKDLGNREIRRNLGNIYEVLNEGLPWASVGDRVMFQRFAGARIWDPQIGEFREDIMFLNDKDIIAILDPVEASDG